MLVLVSVNLPLISQAPPSLVHSWPYSWVQSQPQLILHQLREGLLLLTLSISTGASYKPIALQVGIWCSLLRMRPSYMAMRSQAFVPTEPNFYVVISVYLKPSVLCKWSHLALLNIPAAATAAKLLQSCLTLCDPIDSSPPGPTISGILQARTLEWVAISFSNAWKWSESEVSQLCPTLHDPMDCSLPGSSVLAIFQARVLEWGAVAFSVSISLEVKYLFVVLEKTLESPLDSKEIKTVNPKRN